MKSISAMFVIFFLCIASTNAHACPNLDTRPGTYTEVAVPCLGLSPDFSQEVSVNQAIPLPQGGECRVELSDGESFHVMGQNLVIVNSAKQAQSIGVLINKPSCSQTDGEFYPTWNQVRLQ